MVIQTKFFKAVAAVRVEDDRNGTKLFEGIVFVQAFLV